MAESLFGVILGFYSIFGGAPNSDLPRVTRGEMSAIEWKCAPETWDGNSGMINDQFIGTVSAVCEFKSIHGGGYPQLIKHLNERITTSPEVEQVHAGPKPESYDGMKSSYYDITAKLGSGSDVAHIRSDYHIASNETSRLVFATLSTKVTGTGNSKYVKKTDVIAEVLPKKRQKRGVYTIKMKAHAILDRPWFLPAGTFESMIRDQVKKEAQKTEEQLIKELAENL